MQTCENTSVSHNKGRLQRKKENGELKRADGRLTHAEGIVKISITTQHYIYINMPSVNIVRTIIRGRSVSIGSRREKNMAFIVCWLTGYVSGFFWLDDFL